VSASLENTAVLIAGAGIMGSGIAQVAAQAGHSVMLYDSAPGAAAVARENLQATFSRLVAKGKFSADAASQVLARIEPVDRLEHGAGAGLVIEAVLEDLETKQTLLQQLEQIVTADCVLASNTSSLSVTALANGLQHPERLVGMHFFNPVPLMKLVEVVSGLQTSSEIADSIYQLAQAWGKIAVHARSTPGFIVNRIARPFYAEALALLQEQAATPGLLDACMRGAGFRMGPCELMDLIGHDTNFAVTQSVWTANYYDGRYSPSIVQREMVDGGLLGRKSGRGFYDYAETPNAPATPTTDVNLPAKDASLCVHGDDRIAARIAASLEQRGYRCERERGSDWVGLQVNAAQLRLTDGRCAFEFGADSAVFDLPLQDGGESLLAWSHSAQASAGWIAEAPVWLALLGFVPQRIEDVPGLVVARSVAMIINEAADAVHQGVCTAEAADLAMKLGVNYPVGPFEWLARWHPQRVTRLLDHLDAHYRGERYRVSPWLRRAAGLAEKQS